MTNERTNSYYRDRRMDLLGIRGGMNMDITKVKRMDIMKVKRMILRMVVDSDEGEEWADLFEFVSNLQQRWKKSNDTLSELDEMIRKGESHAELMRTLEIKMGLPQTWEDLL